MNAPELVDFEPDFRNRDTEAGVLSILIAYPDAFDAVVDRLEPCHFADQMHRVLFVELRKQINAGKGVDVLTLADALEGRIALADINEIAQFHDYSARGLSGMVDALVDRFKVRRLYELSHKLQELAFGDQPVQSRIDIAMAELTKLSETAVAEDWVDAYTASIQHTELLEKRHNGEVQGIATGLVELDEMLDGGFHRGNLVIIGARPGMGKSAIGMSIGLHIAERHSVGFMSMEMPHADVRDRMGAMLGHVSISAMKRPKYADLDYERVVEAAERSRCLRFHVSDKSGVNILQLRAKARSLKRKSGLDVLIVDYIGLMPGLDHKMPRAYQIEEITKGLKSLAKELDIVVIALSQVNRGVADRADQTPGLADLRDSGAIEQDADVVAFINRPIVTKPDLGERFTNYGLLRVAKNRQGRLGDVNLFYFPEQTRFASWEGSAPMAAEKSSGRNGGRHEL